MNVIKRKQRAVVEGSAAGAQSVAATAFLKRMKALRKQGKRKDTMKLPPGCKTEIRFDTCDMSTPKANGVSWGEDMDEGRFPTVGGVSWGEDMDEGRS